MQKQHVRHVINTTVTAAAATVIIVAVVLMPPAGIIVLKNVDSIQKWTTQQSPRRQCWHDDGLNGEPQNHSLHVKDFLNYWNAVIER